MPIEYTLNYMTIHDDSAQSEHVLQLFFSGLIDKRNQLNLNSYSYSLRETAH